MQYHKRIFTFDCLSIYTYLVFSHTLTRVPIYPFSIIRLSNPAQRPIALMKSRRVLKNPRFTPQNGSGSSRIEVILRRRSKASIRQASPPPRTPSYFKLKQKKKKEMEKKQEKATYKNVRRERNDFLN